MLYINIITVKHENMWWNICRTLLPAEVPKEILTIIIFTNTDAWTYPRVTHMRVHEHYLHKDATCQKSSQSRNVYALPTWTV